MSSNEERLVLEEAFAFCLDKLDTWLDLDGYPSMTVNGRWQTIREAGFTAGFLPAQAGWVVGFLPGMHWLAFQATGQRRYRRSAARLTLPIARRQDDTTTHDLGFVFYPSFVAAHRLTGEERFRGPPTRAATALARRFNPAGGFIRAWGALDSADEAGATTIDAMMNLALLFWAAEHSGQAAFRAAAMCHAETTMCHLVRVDGWTYQVYDFDPVSGRPLGGRTHQGMHSASRWTRGQAWGLYGFAMTYRFTRDLRFLEVACRLADRFLAALPEDHAPFWDLDAADIPMAARDTSAGAAAASGMLELAELHPEPAVRQYYGDAAIGILCGLYRGFSSKERPYEQGILLHATWHQPARHGVDCSLIFGDYYFMEALIKALMGHKTSNW